MRKAVLVAAVAVVAGLGLPAADTPPRSLPARAAPPPAIAPAGPHTVHIVVSGPADTLMRVARSGVQSQVELGGQPFEYEFVEESDRLGELGISVAANSATPGPVPVHCAITVDGVVVAEQSVRTLDASGLARVSCAIPVRA